ncbi:hypothetical protein EKH55_0717 [Sinorhizobium alkalisoli]|nr:hypothetical protein EKH55_0717 [Sinorhizobium alkalisoli]
MVRNVTRSLPHAALLALAATVYPVPAEAQGVVNCAERSQVIEFLARQYAEKQAAVGLINPRAVMELYAADSGTWTLIVRMSPVAAALSLRGKAGTPRCR